MHSSRLLFIPEPYAGTLTGFKGHQTSLLALPSVVLLGKSLSAFHYNWSVSLSCSAPALTLAVPRALSFRPTIP
jgi:hypothetical protein